MLLIVGVSRSATVSSVIVAIKVSVVVAFIAIGVFYVKTSLWSPLIPAQIPAPPPGTPMDIWHQIGRALWDTLTGAKTSRYGLGGVIHGAAVIFFAYIGFDAVSTAGATDPRTDEGHADRHPGRTRHLHHSLHRHLRRAGRHRALRRARRVAPIATAVNHIGIKWFAEVVKLRRDQQAFPASCWCCYTARRGSSTR